MYSYVIDLQTSENRLQVEENAKKSSMLRHFTIGKMSSLGKSEIDLDSWTL